MLFLVKIPYCQHMLGYSKGLESALVGHGNVSCVQQLDLQQGLEFALAIVQAWVVVQFSSLSYPCCGRRAQESLEAILFQ